MNPPPTGSRREFIASSAVLLGSSWLSMHLPMLGSLAAWARTAAVEQPAFTILTPGEARTMEAFAAQIIPSDPGSPGAKEAGAIWFIDRAIGPGYFPEFREPIRAGILDLDARARRRRSDVTSFADLPSADQIRVMRQVEETPFFFTGRMLSIMGVLADPRHGGNRDGASAKILGIEHRASYQPPFGWYDAEQADARGGRP
jgi:gluconate 2-dehydrogenase gamma chain